MQRYVLFGILVAPVLALVVSIGLAEADPPEVPYETFEYEDTGQPWEGKKCHFGSAPTGTPKRSIKMGATAIIELESESGCNSISAGSTMYSGFFMNEPCPDPSCPDPSTGTAASCGPEPEQLPCVLGTGYWAVSCYPLDPASDDTAKVVSTSWSALPPPVGPALGTCTVTLEVTCRYDSSNPVQGTVGMPGCVNMVTQ